MMQGVQIDIAETCQVCLPVHVFLREITNAWHWESNSHRSSASFSSKAETVQPEVAIE